jgi:hypothetical protein
VDRDVLADEAEHRHAEAAWKIKLLGSLVEVLESERLVLLGKNARLALHVSAAGEEAAATATKLGYTWRRAAQMARLVVMRLLARPQDQGAASAGVRAGDPEPRVPRLRPPAVVPLTQPLHGNSRVRVGRRLRVAGGHPTRQQL